MEENEFYKESFVGKKYNDIYKQKFSWASFFLGAWYWAYRKMIIEAFGLVVLKSLFEIFLLKVLKTILTTKMSNLFSTSADAINTFFVSIAISFLGILIINFIIGIISGFLFLPIYKKFVDRKVKKIIDKDTNDSELEEMKICEKKGGTSVIYIIIFIILSSIITGIINNTKELTNTAKDYDIIQSPLDSSSYNGVISYKTNLKLSDYIDLKVPKDFSKDKLFFDDANYSYEIKDSKSSGVFNSCEFSIAFIENYKSSEKFIREMSEYYNLENEVYTLDINGITWNIFREGDDDNISINYYNATAINGNVLFFEYKIGRDIKDKEKYDEYYKDILTSIVLKDKEKASNSEITKIRKNIKIFTEGADATKNKNNREDGNFEYTLNTKASIKNIKYDIPDIFSLAYESESSVRYTSNEVEDKLEFSIFGVKGKSAQDFIEKAIEENEEFIVQESYTIDLNDIYWNIVAFFIDGNYIYYNAFDYDDRVYLFRYVISENITDESYSQTYEQIITTIKFKEQSEISSEFVTEIPKEIISAEEIEEVFKVYKKDEIYGSEINECISEVIEKNEKDLPDGKKITVEINLKSFLEMTIQIRSENDITNFIRIPEFAEAKFRCSDMEYNNERGYLSRIIFDEIIE